MPSKPPNREEEFELVLGNKQLLSLFFIVVGFFAAFFSVGYMVGFGHGEKTAGAVEVARVEEPAPRPAEPTLPPTLMQDPPEPAPSVPLAEAPKPSPATAPAKTAAAPPPSPPPSRPAQTVPEKLSSESPPPPPTPRPAPSKTAAKPTPKPAAAAPSAGVGPYFLQVAAVRVEKDAADLAGKLKTKGYPASVNAEKSDGWLRVVVGPFSSPEAAQSFKAKLSKDGFDTMLRKL